MTTTAALAALDHAKATYAESRRLGELDCELINLRSQQQNGNRRPWVTEATAEHGVITEERLAAAKAERIAANEIAVEASREAYRALLAAGLAFEVLDHSERLATRPFEVRRTAGLISAGGFLAAHGADLRLARYATRAAAERTIAKTTAAELARLDAEQDR